MAKVKMNGKIIHVSNYKKRDKETKVETGELGWKVQVLFNTTDLKDTSVGQFFPRADVYEGSLSDLQQLRVLDDVEVLADVPMDGNGFNTLLNITKIN